MDLLKNLTRFFECAQVLKLKKDTFENSLFPFYCKDNKGKYINSSEHLVHYAGFSKTEEILGASDNDLYWNSYASNLMKNDREVLFTKKDIIKIETVTILQNSNQLVCKILSFKTPLFIRQGKIIGIKGISILLRTSPITSNRYGLSKRQQECLVYLIRGKSSKEIARFLNLSHRTIESYIDEIKIKMKCSNRAMIIEKTFVDGLLKVDIEDFSLYQK